VFLNHNLLTVLNNKLLAQICKFEYLVEELQQMIRENRKMKGETLDYAEVVLILYKLVNSVQE